MRVFLANAASPQPVSLRLASRSFFGLAIALLILVLSHSTSADETALRQLISDHGLEPISKPQNIDPATFELGRSLFFDRELSGNRNVSCATCHHPSTSSGDSRALPSGVQGHGLGPLRTQDPDREVVPRNAPEVFHRGNEEWNTLFWDSRVAEDGPNLVSPAGISFRLDSRISFKCKRCFRLRREQR